MGLITWPSIDFFSHFGFARSIDFWSISESPIDTMSKLTLTDGPMRLVGADL
jgi:hypothetical protein